MLIQNIALFLPSTAPGLDNVQGASALLSAQVGPRKNKQPSLVLQTSPVVLKFNIDNTVRVKQVGTNHAHTKVHMIRLHINN